MQRRDHQLLEETYNSIYVTSTILNEGITDQVATWIWNLFQKKFPELASATINAAQTLAKTKNLEDASNIIAQALSQNKQTVANEAFSDIIGKAHGAVSSGVSAAINAATPYVQSIQGLASSVSDLPKILNPLTYIDFVQKFWPDLLETFMTTFQELTTGVANDDWNDWINNPKMMIAKKVGIVVLFALLAYGSKKYAENFKNKSTPQPQAQ
jgi:hypothetical protein